MTDSRAALEAGHRLLKDWALRHAAPLWAEKGIDRERGGFVERLDHAGDELLVPRRARLAARQTYSFATLERLGWQAAEDWVAYGFNTLAGGFVTAEGEVIPERTPDGKIARRGHDLYDIAFVLFALATVAASGRERDRTTLLANAVRERLEGHRYARGGFEAGDRDVLPLEANPHMHLMEASLTWSLVNGADPLWGDLADEVAELCLRYFIDADTGRLREFFDADWSPIAGEAGRIVEPGHQFEWAWLLIRWGMLRGRDDALRAATRLVESAEAEGVNASSIAFNAVNDDGSVRDPQARLWPQTERIKGWLAMARRSSDEASRDRAEAHATVAIEGLMRYLDTRISGLWFEMIDANGRPLEEEVRASSLYHILCALEELEQYISSSTIAEQISD